MGEMRVDTLELKYFTLKDFTAGRSWIPGRELTMKQKGTDSPSPILTFCVSEIQHHSSDSLETSNLKILSA